MYLKTQKFLVMGVSKSGYAVAEHLVKNGADCAVYEDFLNEKTGKLLKELLSMGVKKLEREQALNDLIDYDVLVLSPGIPINHEIAVKAKKLGKRIIGEMEYGYLQFLPTVIAITGTNGKTTTSTLIYDILKEADKKAFLVGNVGVPITSKLEEVDKDSLCVTEISSFQLETVSGFCPHISCITNITPDHLERHYTMENYVYLKKRVFKNQRESEYTVLNYDDKIVRNFESELRSKVVWVSLKEKVDGAYLFEDALYYKDERIIERNQLKVKGEHNVYNALFAIAVSKIIGIDGGLISQSLSNFKGVKHRIELVLEKDGIRYYNDSKATNTASTISAIETFVTPTVLILGGSEKGENYQLLFESIKKSMVKHVVLTGASRFNMLESATSVGYANLTLTGDFDFAVKIAKLYAEEGDNVLLSPACASFDCFSGYEERGERFINDVEKF